MQSYYFRAEECVALTGFNEVVEFAETDKFNVRAFGKQPFFVIVIKKAKKVEYIVVGIAADSRIHKPHVDRVYTGS